MENVPSVILLPQRVRVWQDNFTSHLADPLLAMSVQDGASIVQWRSCASVNSFFMFSLHCDSHTQVSCSVLRQLYRRWRLRSHKALKSHSCRGWGFSWIMVLYIHFASVFGLHLFSQHSVDLFGNNALLLCVSNCQRWFCLIPDRWITSPKPVCVCVCLWEKVILFKYSPTLVWLKTGLWLASIYSQWWTESSG